ncbi:unnamed protein product [Effrenium voratum]|uniref:Uncharacterized protein n=1 Tax=Effrenium voratum TaxID=2562239 RepID=A0AA36MKN7_9DINO|nr:unnamed protein product [Effrenium voratum]
MPQHVFRPDAQSNPLRAVITAFACQCGAFDSHGAGPKGQPTAKHLCRRCREEPHSKKKVAYTSLIYGTKRKYVAGALALGLSLQATGTEHDRVLLHTHDVPEEALQLLQELWKLQEVPYVLSAGDLHTSDKARFKDVFTKLHVFNPEVLPFDKVVFLDLDMIVLRNIDELFELRPPAGMSTFKSSGFAEQPDHGQRLHPRRCYVNAGTMVIAPSKDLFRLLVADVAEPDPNWHVSAWSPEQRYLSDVMCGEWTHVSQLYNFEVQLHSGVPLTSLWQAAEAASIAVAHFSGKTKAWDTEPDEDLPLLASEYSRDSLTSLPPDAQRRAKARCAFFHAEWHRMYALALKRCRDGLQGMRHGWASQLSTGLEDDDCNLEEESEFMPGDDVMVEEAADEASSSSVSYLATVLRRPKSGNLILWRQCEGAGFESRICSASANRVPEQEVFHLGLQAVAWLGDGHVLGKITALRDEERLLGAHCPRERRCSTWADLRDRFPDSPLLGGADGRSHLAYSRFKELVRELRSAFAEAGLSPGDRVASVLPNGPEAAGLFLGTALCGLCLGPLDPQLTKTELDFALLDLPAKAIVLGDGLAPVVLSLAEMSARALGLAILRLRRDPITAGDCSFSVDPGFDASDAGVLIPQSCDNICLALHTSGTTRRPKLVALSHANLLSGALCIASTLQIGADDVVMNSLPLFHIHGLAVNVLVPAIGGALSICLSGTFDASAAIRRLKAEPQISLYSAVPTVHHAILTNLRYEDSFPALRLIRNCSAHLPAMLASSVSERMGTEVLPTYAMTESMPIASPTPHGGCHGVEKERHKPSTHSSLGFAAGPEIRLLTTNGLEEPAENISGEICVRGACVTRGYEAREGHDPNQEAFLQGWLKTGDLATVSQNGLILTGRCKEVINKAGEKFSPLQIEEVFLQHPDVEDCVAFAALCEKRGEAIGLAVQARNEQSLDGLRMFGRRTQELRVAALPDCVVWLKELPRTATGKKLRVGLGEKLGLPKLQGDHGEWYADAAKSAWPFDGYGTFTLRPAERFAVRESGSQDLRTVRKIAVDLARCELEDDEPLLDSGLDSLSATTFINALELQLHISLWQERMVLLPSWTRIRL